MNSLPLRVFCGVLLAVLLTPAAAKELLIGGSGTDLATMSQLAEAFSQQRPDVDIKVLPSLGSSGGVRAVARGRLHLGLSSRPLKPAELKYPISSHLYARTPLALVTQRDNPASGVTSEQLFAAMSGKHVYWPDGLLLRLVLRPPSDSDTLIVTQAFPQAEAALAKAYDLRGIPVARTDQAAADMLEEVSGSLGFSALAVVLGEQRALKPLHLDGVAPSPENLARGDYPMGKPLYLVLPPDPDEDALRFARFIASTQGQALLRKTGHLPVPFSLD